MKNHVFRPLIVVIIMVALILAARLFYVPKDFGVHERGYMYGWYRKANEEDWKKFKVKYQGSENCNGPAIDHPSDPPKLAIEKSREHCLRCHFPLPYPTSGRSKIRGVDPEKHNPGTECVACHNPHNPMEGLR